MIAAVGAGMSIAKSRRQFLESAGFGSAALLGTSWLSAARAAAERTPPDLIVINAKVATMDPAMPSAEAFAVRGDRFMAVGSTSDMKSLAGPKTRTYDAKCIKNTPNNNKTHKHNNNNQHNKEQVGNP